MNPPRAEEASLERGQRTWRPGGLVFVTLLVIYSGFWHSRDWNTASRLLLTYAIAQEGTVEITRLVTPLGRRLDPRVDHPPTWDLSSPGQGRYFCDKAPGHSFLGVLPCWLGLRFLGLPAHPPAPVPPESLAYWPTDHWLTWATNGLVTAATGALIVAMLIRMGLPAISSAATGLAFGLATPALPYATLFYGHASAGLFVLLSLGLLYCRPASLAAAALAGMAAGYSVLIEYPLVVFPLLAILVMIAGWLGAPSIPPSAFILHPSARLAAFLAGGLPPALLLGVYHTAVTGSPFRFPYAGEVLPMFAEYHRTPTGVPIGWPDPTVALELLVGRRRGLVWFAPVVLAAVPGSWLLVRRREAGIATISLGTFLGLFAINTGFPAWDGGMAAGPRFLLPAVPLLMIPAGVWLGTPCLQMRWSWLARVGKVLWAAVAVVSGLFMVACNVAGARIPPRAACPLCDHVLPTLRNFGQEPHWGDWVLAYAGWAPRTGFPGLCLMALVVLAGSLATLGLVAATNRAGGTSAQGVPGALAPGSKDNRPFR